MPVIRTPEERFENLPDYPYKPKYVEINGMRVHYVDEGSGEVVMCLHGEPSWSFLYRKMIPTLSEKHRVIAPDFIGFGKSDKYTRRKEYTYEMHRDTLIKFIEQLDLNGITVVVQDWGGLIGLRVVGMMPERFARLVIMNTGLPTGEGEIPKAFIAWRRFSKLVPVLPVGRLLAMGSLPSKPGDKFSFKWMKERSKSMAPEVIAAYEAPFPNRKYKAGARAWPLMVPIKPDDPVSDEMRKAQEGMRSWNKPALVMFSDGDPITRGGDEFFRELIPTAKDQPEIVIKDAGHFLQERKGEEIAGNILDFIERAPTG